MLLVILYCLVSVDINVVLLCVECLTDAKTLFHSNKVAF